MLPVARARTTRISTVPCRQCCQVPASLVIDGVGEIGAYRRGRGHAQSEHQQWRHQDTTAHPRQTNERADDQTVDRQQPVSTHPLPSSRLAWQSSRFLAGNRPIPTKSIAFT